MLGALNTLTKQKSMCNYLLKKSTVTQFPTQFFQLQKVQESYETLTHGFNLNTYVHTKLFFMCLNNRLNANNSIAHSVVFTIKIIGLWPQSS